MADPRGAMPLALRPCSGYYDLMADRDDLEQIQRLIDAVNECDGHVNTMAGTLGVDIRTVHRWIDRFRLRRCVSALRASVETRRGGRGVSPRPSDAAIVAALAAYPTSAAAGRALGVPERTFARWAQRLLVDAGGGP